MPTLRVPKGMKPPSLLDLAPTPLAAVGEGEDLLKLLPQSLQDFLKPEAGSTMDRMFSENNPIFKALQRAGLFEGDRTVTSVGGQPPVTPPGDGLSETRYEELMKKLGGLGK